MTAKKSIADEGQRLKELKVLKDQYRHELMDEEKRLELLDAIKRMERAS